MLYTNKFINSISLIITIIIFLILNYCIFDLNIQKIVLEAISKINPFNEISQKEESIETKNDEKQDLGNWYIEIPSINLKAPIVEGTALEILASNVGHFENTSNKEGNIGLAAYNDGARTNSFKDLKNVEIGDEIFYVCKDFKETYIIDIIEIIVNTNWNYLKPSDEDKITLITNIENEPNYRRCVQATAMEN